MTIKNADAPAMPVDRCDADAIDAGIQVFSGLTKRETFCLYTGVPETGDAELDEIIRKGNQQSPVVPDGWQLVPVEPTVEMVKAATHSAVGFGTRAAYQAMLAAAPKPEGAA